MSIKFFMDLYQNPVNSEVPTGVNSETPMLFRPKVLESAVITRQEIQPTQPIMKKAAEPEVKIVIPAGRPALRRPPNSIRVNGDVYSRPKQAEDDESWVN